MLMVLKKALLSGIKSTNNMLVTVDTVVASERSESDSEHDESEAPSERGAPANLDHWMAEMRFRSVKERYARSDLLAETFNPRHILMCRAHAYFVAETCTAAHPSSTLALGTVRT
jgi:hypothetical protein